MVNRTSYQLLAWLSGILFAVVLAPVFALAILAPNSGFVARIQDTLYPSVAMLSSNLDLHLVALAGGPSTSPQTTHTTSTPTKLTGGGQGQFNAISPRVFGFNVQLNSSFQLVRGHWNSQNPRCNGEVTAIFPQPDPSNGFNFRVSCKPGGDQAQLDVKAEDGTPHSQPDKLDTNNTVVGEPTQPIKNGNIKAH